MNFTEQFKYTKNILFFNKIKVKNIFSFLIPYFTLTIISTLLEGVTLLLFINFFTRSNNDVIPIFIKKYLLQFEINNKKSILLLMILLSITIVIKFALTYYEGYISAKLRP